MSSTGNKAQARRQAPKSQIRDSIDANTHSEDEMMVSQLLPPDYVPTDAEEFMNPMQREYFRRKLHNWRTELVQESELTRDHLQNESLSQPDVLDRASVESERSLELRTRDRYRKLIAKIDAALVRIETDKYGYCEITGHPIGIRRLDARPVATMTVEAQTQHERTERTQNLD